jgi:hypothetical protein
MAAPDPRPRPPHWHAGPLWDVPALVFVALVVFIFVYEPSYSVYADLYADFPAALSFLKFAVLATFGEMLVARLRAGRYLPPAFGLLPKALVWGVLGVFIWIAFGVFSNGVSATFFPGLVDPAPAMQVLRAFTISFFMNIIFAPMMMMTHHLTDTFIAEHDGRFPVSRFNLRPLLGRINWDKMWGFVYKKTIPFFWIPAHTVTFLLPAEIRVLFAVVLSVVLGLLLTISAK